MDLDFSLSREGPGTYKQHQLEGVDWTEEESGNSWHSTLLGWQDWAQFLLKLRQLCSKNMESVGLEWRWAHWWDVDSTLLSPWWMIAAMCTTASSLLLTWAEHKQWSHGFINSPYFIWVFSLQFFIWPSKILILSVFLKLPLGLIISKKKGELRIILLTLLG